MKELLRTYLEVRPVSYTFVPMLHYLTPVERERSDPVDDAYDSVAVGSDDVYDVAVESDSSWSVDDGAGDAV